MCTSACEHLRRRGALRFHHGFHLARPLELEPGILGSNRDATAGSQQLQLWKRATFLGCCQGSSYLYLVESRQSQFNDQHLFIIMSSTCAETYLCLNTGYPRSKPISIGFSPQLHELNSHNWGAIHHFQSQMDCNQTATKESFGQCNGWRSLLYFMGCSSDALK
jgi:hypothetical protein